MIVGSGVNALEFRHDVDPEAGCYSPNRTVCVYVNRPRNCMVRMYTYVPTFVVQVYAEDVYTAVDEQWIMSTSQAGHREYTSVHRTVGLGQIGMAWPPPHLIYSSVRVCSGTEYIHTFTIHTYIHNTLETTAIPPHTRTLVKIG